jgi:hypothetical protein
MGSLQGLIGDAEASPFAVYETTGGLTRILPLVYNHFTTS